MPKFYFFTKINKNIRSFKLVKYLRYKHKFNIIKNINDEYVNKFTSPKVIT
jgi:hypothetical protein